ncbi:hypothetical protein HBI64_155450 [Parastagonospora nodorum]|nr:hypothetical protein HBH47_218150 [Parastagonospora nodorum]KAH5014134.1 hypothetical protein HBI74_184390 [Parastagonospora nodorum]KAH6122918.1 hypothetical protein HBI64_155450 [Parastagonospora nodorum]
MDHNSTPSRRYRVDPRHYSQTQNTRQDDEKRRDSSKGEGKPRDPLDQPPTHQEEEKRKSAMTKDHRFFHRRQAASPTKVLTVNVEVIATVDSGGNLVAQETKTQAPTSPQASPPSNIAPPIVNAVGSPVDPAVSAAAALLASPAAALSPVVPIPALPSIPQVPAVPAVPTVALPVVPSVPPFPSDLTVPAYPFSSGVPALAVDTSTGSLTPSPAPTSMSGSSISPSSLLLASLIPASNSTIPSMSLLSSSASSTSGSNSATLSSSVSDRFTAAAFTGSSSANSVETSSTLPSSVTPTADVDSTMYYAGGGAAGTAYPPGGAAQTTTASGASATGSTTPLQTPQVVGSVVGSLAGAALILAVILLLLRRHKRRRQGALQLADETTDRSPPPMIQNDSKAYRIPSAFLNRFSGISRSTVESSTTASGERGFQRVSGRKLPSAFSGGMTSEQFSGGGTLSGSSFYMDDQGTYGSPGLPKEFGKDVDGAAAAGGAMNIRQGPRRTPIIRHPDDDANPFADPAPFPRANAHLTPPQSPKRDARPNTLGRSLYSHDGSRSSKFTENV